MLGRRYGIAAWLPGAYEAVCTRTDPLTLEEGMKLGVEDCIRIAAARQAYGCGQARFETQYLAQDLGEIFGLEGGGVGPADVDDEAIVALESEVYDAEAALPALPAPPALPVWGEYDDDTFDSVTWESPCGDGPTCGYYGDICKPVEIEIEERRLKREDKEAQVRRLQDLKDHRQQRQRELAGKQERMSLFRL